MKSISVFSALLLMSLSSLVSANQMVVIEDAVVSCIRMVEDGQDWQDVEPELFFWSEKAAEKADQLLFDEGYTVRHGVNSVYWCGSFTPIINVKDSRDRRAVKSAINRYQRVIEDSDQVWVNDIEFVKK